MNDSPSRDELKNPAAFEKIYKKYYPKLYRYSFRLMPIGDIEERHDVIQEVFMKVYKNIQSFDPKKGSFSSWIYRIMHNELVGFMNKKSFRKHQSLDDIVENGFEEKNGLYAEKGADYTVNRKKTVEKIDEVLSKMKDRDAEILVRKYIYDQSLREIGKEMGYSTGGVCVMISRARNRFSKLSHGAFS